MYFKKSNRYCDENIGIKLKLESMRPNQVCGLALLYIDYRINYNKKDKSNKEGKLKLSLFMLFKEAQRNETVGADFFSEEGFAYSISKVCNRSGGWQTLDCALDWMELDSGPTGRMNFQRKAEILQIIRVILEEYYELPVSEIIKYVSNLDG